MRRFLTILLFFVAAMSAQALTTNSSGYILFQTNDAANYTKMNTNWWKVTEAMNDVSGTNAALYLAFASNELDIANGFATQVIVVAGSAANAATGTILVTDMANTMATQIIVVAESAANKATADILNTNVFKKSDASYDFDGKTLTGVLNMEAEGDANIGENGVYSFGAGWTFPHFRGMGSTGIVVQAPLFIITNNLEVGGNATVGSNLTVNGTIDGGAITENSTNILAVANSNRTDFVAADTTVSNALQIQITTLTNGQTIATIYNPFGTNSYLRWNSTTQLVVRLYEGGIESNIYVNLYGD